MECTLFNGNFIEFHSSCPASLVSFAHQKLVFAYTVSLHCSFFCMWCVVAAVLLTSTVYQQGKAKNLISKPSYHCMPDNLLVNLPCLHAEEMTANMSCWQCWTALKRMIFTQMVLVLIDFLLSINVLRLEHFKLHLMNFLFAFLTYSYITTFCRAVHV